MSVGPSSPARADAYRRFNVVFLGAVACAWVMLAVILVGLRAQDRLPPPPLSGTPCLDAKFSFYKERLDAPAARSIDLLAVGSSATARNLDTDALAAARPDLRPFNAAMCYLHIDQTAYLASYLLERIPGVEVLLVIGAPRDFEHCPPRSRAYFDPARLDRFISGRFSAPLVFATGLRPSALFRVARAVVEDEPTSDDYRFTASGDWPMRVPNDWMPEPRFDPACVAALSELEAVAAAHGTRLVFVHFPTAPAWKQRFDPDGQVLAAHRERVRSALTLPTTRIVDGDEHPVRPDEFADPVHLLWSSTGAFTRFIAARLG
jgi:hypothetical protein